MAKFSKGDRVRNLEDNWVIPYLSEGTVGENYSSVPYVRWDETDTVNAQEEELLELIDPSSEIAHILESAVEREQSNNELQKYTFTYTDVNREITHVFKEEMLEYDLEDVVAEFRAFLLGLGFTAEHIGGLIDESKL